jgi:hypothetical protein
MKHKRRIGWFSFPVSPRNDENGHRQSNGQNPHKQNELKIAQTSKHCTIVTGSGEISAKREERYRSYAESVSRCQEGHQNANHVAQHCFHTVVERRRFPEAVRGSPSRLGLILEPINCAF